MKWILTAIAVLVSAQAWGQETKQSQLDYKTAYHRAKEGDKPLLVLVTAQWCGPCQVLKSKAFPELKTKGTFEPFHFAVIDYDAEPALAQNLIGDRGIPQFILFEKREEQWSRRYLVGAQTVAEVEEFLVAANRIRVAATTDQDESKK